MHSSFFKNKSILFISLIMLIFTVSGCDMASNYLKIDRNTNSEFQDYRDALSPRAEDPAIAEAAAKAEKRKAQMASVPGFQSYIAQSNSAVRAMPLVSLSVNQSVPLRDVLYELARQAGFDLELDPSITGGIIFSAHEKPLDDVIERIADLSGLRYNFKDNVLRVEVDRPYAFTYQVDYLSYIRSTEGSIRNSVAVVSGDGADTGSSFEASSESEADFWGELSDNLTQILNSARARMVTADTPQIGAFGAQNDDGTLNIDALPVDGRGSSAVASSPMTFTVNKQAGLVNVFATEEIQARVKDYLALVRRSVTAQVLIEAKILEVGLTDQFSAGIDWQVLGGIGNDGVVGFGTAINNVSNAARVPLSPAGNGTNFQIGAFGNDVEALVQAISGFGTVSALASPRLTVLNNQSAVLNVADNRVFFELDIDVTTDEGTTETEIDSEIRNVPEGVLVNVQPSINLENGTISLAVRPTITRVVREVADPAVQFVVQQNNIQGIESLIPELNVQEIDTVIQVRSGQPVVMGGLLQDRTNSTQEGLPILGEVPVFGALFRNQQDKIEKSELVILLKATIIENHNNIHDADRDIYKKFARDRRPFGL